ncbi:hypothetical protein [Brachybacterium vulturis]|uniref:hypothetical protein n=1 Tax=Brachybacterium vulturis TaxID=2017484 RepID=UPI001FECD13A|nr:hypothetical protein [Brachybacterium vulturis]
MEINPLESRLRMLQQIDGVQMQREATPDEETAGCPGCPYFWTCPVPHRGEEVRAPAEIELEDVREALGPRRAFSPRDESDVGWTDVWVDEEGLPIDPEELPVRQERHPVEGPSPDSAEEAPEPDAEGDSPAPARRRARRGLFRRR